jgi:hypothetical protein
MLNCVEVTEMCSRELEQPLKLGEKVALHTHLMMCTGCSNFRKQMSVLRVVAQGYAEGHAPPGEDAVSVGDGGR